jgi:Mannosyl-glycoprotein endo-beta-N-acetylglucosaminidase
MRVLSNVMRCLLLVALIGVGVVVGPNPTAPASPAGAASGIPVMGPSILNANQLVAWFNAQHRTPNLSVSIQQLANDYLWEGGLENVRGDIAFAQSIVETGYFGFVGSMVLPSDNNFAGMGACDTCSTGRGFPSAQVGVRAQIQHLKNYADPTSRAATLKNPPVVEWYGRRSNGTLDPALAIYNFDHFFAKGRAPTWNQMGNGNWATAPNYSTAVLAVYNKMLTFNGLPGNCPPDSLAYSASQANACPAALRQPGRAVATRDSGYYVLSGTGFVATYNGAPSYGSPSFNFDIARDIAMMPDGAGYIVLDGYGGLHKFGSARQGVMRNLPSPGYWPGWDIARSLVISTDGKGLAVLDGFGAIHTAGDITAPKGGPFWPGWDIARGLGVTADRTGFYVLDGFGAVWNLGTAPHHASPWFGWDIARDIVILIDGSGYAVLDGFGGLHSFGAMPNGNNIGYVQADRWRSLAISNGRLFAGRNDGYTAKG